MQATFQVLNQGNLAIQEEVWTIPVEVAKQLLKVMKADGELSPGSYWTNHFAKPARSAIRKKQDFVKVTTAGFSTGQFASKLACIGCESLYTG